MLLNPPNHDLNFPLIYKVPSRGILLCQRKQTTCSDYPALPCPWVLRCFLGSEDSGAFNHTEGNHCRPSSGREKLKHPPLSLLLQWSRIAVASASDKLESQLRCAYSRCGFDKQGRVSFRAAAWERVTQFPLHQEQPGT